MVELLEMSTDWENVNMSDPIDSDYIPHYWLLEAEKLTEEIKREAAKLTPEEARYHVSGYYTSQLNRTRHDNQIRSMKESGEPTTLIHYLSRNSRIMEKNIQAVLLAYAQEHKESAWAMSITGIGPVIASGLAAHIDVTRAATAGAVWRFAGQDPTSIWGKNQKRPWNAKLKTLCWKIGESFVKVQNKESDIYGKIYKARRALEEDRNNDLQFAEQAEVKLKIVGKDTEAYKYYSVGKLPPNHLYSRSKRYAVKLFLAHYHHAAYMVMFGREPEKPYILNQPGHTHMIVPPNLELITG